MTNPKTGLNGSTELLAKAMRKVFDEAYEPVVPMLEKGLKEVNNKTDTTNKNMSAQFSQQKKDIAEEIGQQLKR